MRKLLLVLIACVAYTSLPAQDDSTDTEEKPKKRIFDNQSLINIGSNNSYISHMTNRYSASFNLLSNQGGRIGFENRMVVKWPLHLCLALDMAYWNNSFIGPYYDPLTKVVDDAPVYKHSINNLGLMGTFSFAIPLQVKKLTIVSRFGINKRWLLSSKGKTYNPTGELINTKTGYRRTNYSGITDHMAISIGYSKIKNFELKLETDNLLNGVFDYNNDWIPWTSGYFHRATDSLSNYYNFIVKVCYKGF